LRGKLFLAGGPYKRDFDSHTDSEAPFSNQPTAGVGEAAQLPASKSLDVRSIPDASGRQGSPKIFSYLQVSAAHAASLPPLRAHLLRCLQCRCCCRLGHGCADSSRISVLIEGFSKLAADRWICVLRSLRRTRHHCRLCGAIFCASCSAGRMLLPPKFQEGTPQRVCTNCAALLMPLQPFLAGAPRHESSLQDH
jgi:hypothetical protein